ncbi:phage major capsid protein [Mycobacterium sp. 20091114027_K0903767]|nr:phage major capsid protein [Mycobacterium sp. 20091114027_K0903767]
MDKRITQLFADRKALAENEASADRIATKGLGPAALDALDDEPVVSGDTDKRLSFNAKMATGLISRKSVAANGAAVVAQEFEANPITMGKPATSLLDVLPTKSHSSPQYSYLRQTTRTNNAAVVPSGATKPTSIYSVTRVEQSLSVIAHLSEGVDHYWLADNAFLHGFLTSELQYGLSKAVEAKVLADINGTSGIATQAWATSIPVTLRKALTQLELTGYIAGAIVLHPNDFETIELAMSTTNAVEHMGLPYDPASRRLYGVPIATTVAQAAGVGHVLARDAVRLDVDTQGVQLTWSETSNADDFAKNLTRARLEGRYGTSVFAPLGVVVADLTSA